MQTKRILSVAALSLLLPLAAQAQPPRSADTGITAEIRRELGDARKEVRAELAKAKQDLDTGDLQLQDSLQFGKQRKTRQHDADRDIGSSKGRRPSCLSPGLVQKDPVTGK